MSENNGAIEHRLGVLEKQVDKLNNCMTDNSNRLIIVEKSQEVMEEKLEGLSKHTEAIVGMSYEVKNLAVEVSKAVELIEKQDRKIDKQDERLDEIENKPGKLGLKAWMFVIAYIATAVLSYVVGKL